jgi:hypothetical protein
MTSLDLVDAVETSGDSQGGAESRSREKPGMIDILNELGQFGPACRKIGMNCLVTTRTPVTSLRAEASLDRARIYAVVGTLATETDNAHLRGPVGQRRLAAQRALNVPTPN